MTHDDLTKGGIQTALLEYTNVSSYIDPGQAFRLTQLSRLARQAGDPDWDYPDLVEDGVPLGVEEPMPRSPDIWPAKQERGTSHWRAQQR